MAISKAHFDEAMQKIGLSKAAFDVIRNASSQQKADHLFEGLKKEAKTLYRKAIFHEKLHPDINGGDAGKTALFILLTNAMDVLASMKIVVVQKAATLEQERPTAGIVSEYGGDGRFRRTWSWTSSSTPVRNTYAYEREDDEVLRSWMSGMWRGTNMEPMDDMEEIRAAAKEAEERQRDTGYCRACNRGECRRCTSVECKCYNNRHPNRYGWK